MGVWRMTGHKTVEESLREQMEKALEESEARYRQLVENASDIIFRADEGGYFTFVNPAALRSTGYPENEILGKHYTELIRQDHRETAMKFFGRQYVKKIPTTYHEFPLVAKNGGTLWIGQNTQLIMDGETVVGFQSIARDISDRKLAQDTLRESEGRLQGLVEHIPQRIFIKDRNSVYLYCNKQYASDHGITPDQIKGKDDFEFYTPEMALAYRADDEACMATGTARETEKPYQCNGQELWIHTIKVPYRDGQGQIIGVLGLFEDITDRKQMELTLRDSESRLRSLAETIPDALVVYDDLGRVLFANNAFEELYDWSAEELLGKSISNFVPPEEEEITRQYWESVVRGEKARLETRRRTKQGRLLDLELSTSTLFNADGKHAGTIVVHHDITERKRIEEELRQREEELATILDAIPAMVWTCLDPECRVITGNRLVNELFGVPSGTNISQTAAQKGEALYIKHLKTDGTEYRADELPMQQAIASGQSILDQEIEYRLSDGRKVFALGNTVPLFDDKGVVRGSVSAFQDISARKKAEESLLESERLFRSYIKYAPDGVFVADGKGKYIEANDAASSLTGYDRDELLGANFIDLIASEDVGEALLHFNRADETGYSTGDLRYVTKTGEKRWWTVNGVKLDEDRFLGFARDITERKANEKALRESEEKYRQLVETIGDWVWASDPDGRHTYSNPAVTRLLGYQINEVVGSSAFQLIHPDDEQPIREMLKNCIEEGVGWNNVSIRWLHQDGLARSFESSAIPILNSENQVTGFRGVDRDINERTRLEAERREMERKILHAEKLESLALMAGGIAHDFNNQLAVVLGNLELALSGQGLDSSTQKAIKNAVAAAKRSAELSRQMQIYTGNTLYHPAFLDLNELLQNSYSSLKLAISRNVNINLEIYNSLPLIWGDPDQIQRLVTNLLVNASESIGDQDGDLKIITGARDCDDAYLSLSRLEQKPESGRFIFLEVSDTGCGMDADTQHKLFDPFFTMKFMGRGLGMAEVMGIVKGHRGAIMVDSDVEKGTTIRVLFPVSKKFQTPRFQTASSRETKATMPESVSRRKTVLVIDDEEQVREFCCEWLDLLGYDTIAAVDGVEGVHVFCERMNEIDIVLMDFVMPRMNGIEAFEELIRIKPDLNVILCSGYTEKEIGLRFPDRKPASILHKPYDMDTLKAELERLLGTTG
jgi:PAS domain S-box-containing protein